MGLKHVFRKFSQGDKVSYDGRKFSDLGGKLGIVDAYITNEDGALVVSFGDDAYVIAESNLRPFQGHLRQENSDRNKDETKNPDIQKRRGGKRKPEDQEAV